MRDKLEAIIDKAQQAVIDAGAHGDAIAIDDARMAAVDAIMAVKCRGEAGPKSYGKLAKRFKQELLCAEIAPQNLDDALESLRAAVLEHCILICDREYDAGMKTLWKKLQAAEAQSGRIRRSRLKST